MIQTGFESKVKIQQILDNQLPEFVLSESPDTANFLKQYYISQEYQGGPVDISDNLSEYLKLDNLVPEVIVDSTVTTGITTIGDTTISVNSTKGFPNQYGLLKIDDEIITYTSLNAEKNKFVGCIRGFCGITSYHTELNPGELIFSDTTAVSHSANSNVQNLSSLFLKEFYKKQKSTLTPDLVDVDFAPDVNVGNFIKESRSLYESKGTDESFRILFNVLYGETPRIINLEDYLLKPSSADYVRREIIIADVISGDPSKLVGQTIFKADDLNTNASISGVEPFTRIGVDLGKNKQYWKISLFMGYDKSASTIQGNFKITPASKCLESVSIGSSVISVDSTVGFGTTGNIVVGNNNITYTDKSINQFFGCVGIDNSISPSDVVRNDEIYFSYESGDITKKVELRLTGVLSDFEQISKNINVDEGQIISVNGIGDIIEDKLQSGGDVDYANMSYKEIFANSWIYNTSVRFKLKSLGTPGMAILFEPIYSSSLKIGDRVEILERGTNNVKDSGYGGSPIIVTGFDYTTNVITLDNQGYTPEANIDYDLRRKINNAQSTIVPLEYDKIISDVQNLYIEDDKFAYVASNSLPSSTKSSNNTNNFTNNITINVKSATVNSLSDKNVDTGKYGLIRFDTPVPFITGDEVYYEPISPSQHYVGLETGNYYVKTIPDSVGENKQIRLYSSRSFVNTDTYIQFGNQTQSTEANSHKFILSSQKSNIISPQKLLKKFSLESTINSGKQTETSVGSVGLLKDGVEIINYKSLDKIYYGPLNSINIFNGGTDYDVINTPKIEIVGGIGVTALVQPVLSGTVVDVKIDKQQFDINKVVSIDITGGNGNAILDPITVQRSRKLKFDGRKTTNSGGVNVTTDEITFSENHNFKNHEKVIYKSDTPNTGIGIGSTPGMLVNNAAYYANVINNNTIKLYNNFEDSVAGINTVGLNTHITTVVSTAVYSGTHAFVTLPNQTSIVGVDIVDGGTFTNRKLIVKPSGISTSYDSITFKDHGFKDGEIIEYTTTGTQITGLIQSTGIVTTANQYKVSKIDNDSFKLCDAGIAGTITSNYTRKNYVSLGSTGTGYHNFAYPDINVNINYIPVGLGTDTQIVETITATPTVKGSIIDTYLYESGTGYGSSTLNFEEKPLISIKNGKDGQLKPIIIDGKLDSINLQFGGTEYYSIPDLDVVDSSGKGSGAELRAVVTDNKITNVEIINAGIGYSSANTSIKVVSRGKNALLSSNIRPLSVNLSKRYGNEVLLNSENNLKYGICGYNQKYRDSFGEVDTQASKIIGWAYDGNPIYGPYGPEDPENSSSTIKRLTSGYTLDTSNVIDRPSSSDFAEGFFVEDYKFTNNGDLDRNNGRFSKTKEFPNGIYAYFATIDDVNPQFPYFVGDSYRSLLLEQNINQSFDFINSNLIRNTFPYRVSDENTDNDFIIETNEISKQKSIVETVTSGPIEEISVISSGDNYKINDTLQFDNTDTNGSGLIGKISSLKGKDIVDINSSIDNFNDSIFTSNNNKVNVTILPHHDLETGNVVSISGFSTELSLLNKSYVIGVTTYSGSLTYPLESSTVGVSTEIWISKIPESISIGSSLTIGNETLKLLNVYPDIGVLKVERGSTGVAHTASSKISFLPDSFDITQQNISSFESKVNKKVYFNPKESIGFGTVSGISSTMTFGFANSNITVNVPTQRIYIENHPFKDNDLVTFTADTTAIAISTDNNPSTTFNLPSTVYISNSSRNTIGIKTGLGADYSDVFFISGGQDKDTYSFETNYTQITGNVEKNVAKVSVSTSHSLKKGDNVTLNIQPNLSVGIGTSSSVRIEKQEGTNYILVDPIGFNSTGINTSKNQITLNSHGLKTGDKISYSADLFPSGISAKAYYVYKVNNDIIKLCETDIDANNNPPTTIGIGSTGGIDQSIKLINPTLTSIKNNNLVFDLSHSSLEDYKFKFYYDNTFKNEFVSTSSTTFNVVAIGTPGISTNASVTLQYNNLLPFKLYYNLEKSGFINTTDISVSNYSEITFNNSSYNSSYDIVSIGDTTFDVLLNEIPEKLSYNQSECSTLNYTTKSLNEKGGVNRITILDRGDNYEKLPKFVGTSSTEGTNINVLPKSKLIGNPKNVRIINEGFEYSSDKTLQPSSYISPLININNSNTIGIITVTSGGEDYISTPNIVIIDSESRNIVDNGILEASMNGNSIARIDQTLPPKGISDSGIEIFAVNNSNGVAISSITSNSTGIFTCFIQTPSLNFITQPFVVGDEVYIEGITKLGTDGSGFNSSELGYKFGKVSGYTIASSASLDSVTIDVRDMTTNTGIAVTNQNFASSLIHKSKYPTFSVLLEPSLFNIGEKIISNGIQRDLTVTHTEYNYIKISGTYRLSVGDIITGSQSGTIATINDITENFGRFSVNFMVQKDIGWSDDVGSLNFDSQVIPDNDYYQNLSYSIQSSKTFDELRSPVTSLLHTSGLKNFADVGIKSTSVVGVASTSTLIRIQDYVNDLRVDTINNFDFAYDLGNNDVSSSIGFQNKRLTEYTLSKSNEVLIIDNIKNQFSNIQGESTLFLDFFKVDSSVSYREFSIVTTNLNATDIQATQLVLLNNGSTSILFQRNQLEDENNIGTFDIIETIFDETYIRFTPKPDGFDYDYNLKTVETTFNDSIGFGSQPVGFTSLSSSIGLSPVDTTTTIISVDSDKYESFYTKNQLINETTNEMNYVEVYATHDGTDTYISEFFTDTYSQREGYSNTLSGVGSFKADLTGTQFSFQFENTSSDIIKFKSNIVGFGTTAAGIGTYRFLAYNQPAESERSVIYESNYNTGIGTTVVYSANKTIFNAFMSVVEVSVGSTKALHTITSIHDSTDVIVQQGPILSSDGIGNGYSGNGGIGTFGGEYIGNDFILNFHPDSEFLEDTIQVSSFNEVFYTVVDFANTPNIIDLTYGGCTRSLNAYAYNAINGERINRTNFELRSNNTPIFAKSFDPSDSSVLTLDTGTFNIKDHFFRTDEELIYTPKSTFVGVGSTPMQYKSAAGIHTLPSTVFAIRNNTDSFQISTTKAGTAVTFMDVGEGNAHEFAMGLSNTKSIITINDLIQSPLAFTPINHTLKDNIDDSNTGISTSRSNISLSGISSIFVGDILKVDDEYMKVLNVGVGTTSIGPITGIGTTTLVEVERGSVGTSATNHTNSSTAQVYRGSYNIVGKEIHFTDAPRGNPQSIKNESNLNYPTSDFSGRVFLRNDYSTNRVYDDISDQFTGIGQTFTLKVGGANTVGLGSTGGNGLLTISNIFQRPTAENNPRNNYEISEDITSGITSVTFTGITSTIDGDLFIDEYDVNENELPKGGIIVSLGSTPGKGYAPAEGAKAYLEKDANGTITNIVGVATTGPSNGVTTAFYDNTTGFLEVITTDQHNFESGIVKQVKLHRLEFACSGSYGITTTFFPSNNNVGLGSTSLEYSILDTSPGYYDHKFVSGVNGGCVASNGNTNTYTAKPGTTYNPATGELVLQFSGVHGLTTSNKLTINDGAVTFTCDRDSYATEHSYPRPTDPASGQALTITAVTATTVTVNVGTSQTKNRFTTNVGTSTIPHSYVGGGSVMPWYGDATFGSGYYGNVSVAVTDVPYTHKFVSAASTTLYKTNYAGTAYTATSASYNTVSGYLTLNIPSHGLTTSDNVGIRTGSLVFTCSKDDYQSLHSYPRATDPVGGEIISIASTTTNTITLDVGSSVGSGAQINAVVGAGGSLAFTLVGGGKTYNNPQLVIPDSSYSNLSVTGVSRLGVGETTDTGVGMLVDVEVGPLTITSTDHTFVPGSENDDAVQKIDPVGTAITPTGATYIPSTGVLTLTFDDNHNLVDGNTIRLVDNSLTFTCAKDNYATEHTYPRATDPISGVTTGIGNTTLTSFDINVGQTSFTGISTLFGVTKWQIARDGYAFKKGDVLKPVGLVTDANLTTPVSEFELTVLDTYTDAFSAWQFGQMDYIDSIKDLQDGERRRFELRYDGQLLSFESDVNSEFPRINLSNTLFIVINGVIQKPGSAYFFDGGTTFTFTTPPEPYDDVAIFFYRGTSGSDSTIIDNIIPTVKQGDTVQLDKMLSSDVNQQERNVNSILTSKSVQTNVYKGVGLNDDLKTLNWTKQKSDKIINSEIVSKSRDSLEPMIFPTAKVIGKISETGTTIFVDEARFFDEEGTVGSKPLSAIIIDNSITPVAAAITAIVSTAGTISSLDIVNGGIGYTVAPSIAIGIPTTGIVLPDDTVSDVETVWRVTSTGTGHWSFNGGDLSNAYDPTLNLIRGQKYRFENRAGGTHEFRIQSTPNGSVGTQYNDGVTNNDAGDGTDLIFEVPSNAPTVLYYQCTQHTAMGGVIYISDTVPNGTATAVSTIDSNGTITSTNITYSGLGYTTTTPPQVLVLPPSFNSETITNIGVSTGISGIITGISTTTGNGTPLALTFNLYKEPADGYKYSDLAINYPIYISNTQIGTGVTSIYDSNDAKVGIGTTFLDNVYNISYTPWSEGNVGIITCNVIDDSSLVGIASTGSSSIAVGRFSLGRLSGFTRNNNPIAIAVTGKTINSGLTTFPTIQRRGVGWRDTGSVNPF